jgi:hypothetical protein
VPVAAILDFESATLDQYDQVLEKMSLEPQFETFADEQIGPYAQEVGITNPPTVEVYEIPTNSPRASGSRALPRAPVDRVGW